MLNKISLIIILLLIPANVYAHPEINEIEINRFDETQKIELQKKENNIWFWENFILILNLVIITSVSLIFLKVYKKEIISKLHIPTRD